VSIKTKVIELFREVTPKEHEKDFTSILDGLRLEGMLQGRQQGIWQEKLSVVKNLLESNTSLDIISKATSLPLEEIIKLKTKLH
jgi:hypothetical protein